MNTGRSITLLNQFIHVLRFNTRNILKTVLIPQGSTIALLAQLAKICHDATWTPWTLLCHLIEITGENAFVCFPYLIISLSQF